MTCIVLRECINFISVKSVHNPNYIISYFVWTCDCKNTYITLNNIFLLQYWIWKKNTRINTIRDVHTISIYAVQLRLPKYNIIPVCKLYSKTYSKFSHLSAYKIYFVDSPPIYDICKYITIIINWLQYYIINGYNIIILYMWHDRIGKNKLNIENQSVCV